MFVCLTPIIAVSQRPWRVLLLNHTPLHRSHTLLPETGRGRRARWLRGGERREREGREKWRTGRAVPKQWGVRPP